MSNSQARVALYGVVEDTVHNCVYMERIDGIPKPNIIVVDRKVVWLGFKLKIRNDSALICDTPIAAVQSFLKRKQYSVINNTELLSNALLMIFRAKILCNEVAGETIYDMGGATISLPDFIETIDQFKAAIKEAI